MNGLILIISIGKSFLCVYLNEKEEEIFDHEFFFHLRDLKF